MSSSNSTPILRIVVLDDEPLVLSGITMLLESLGHKTRGIADGQTLLQVVESGEEFDLAILDLKVKGGAGAVEIAEDLGKALPNIRMFVSSGVSEAQLAGEYASQGFHDFLPKPFTLDQLKALLAKHFG